MSRNLFVAALFLVSASSAVWAFPSGAGVGYAGAPGDIGNCTVCHTGTPVNQGTGGVSIVLPDTATYAPGTRQRISISITDPSAKRWGFELTVRLDSNPTAGQAGGLSSITNLTQLTCLTNPCSSTAIQYLSQTAFGTQNGTPAGVTYTFDWNAPQTDVGSITFYVSALAADGNGSATGDRTYTSSLQLINPRPWPIITSVTNLPSGAPGASPGSWIAVNGSLLANSTRTWTPAEAAAGLPTSLDGVSVLVNDQPGYVQSISPTKLIVLTPSATPTGSLNIWVTNNTVSGVPFRTVTSTVSPGFLTGPDNRHAVMSLNDTPLGNRLDNMPSVVPQPPAAFPGQSVSFYGTGFGTVKPAITDGALQAAPASITTPFSLTIGGEPVIVSSAGLAPGFAAIYQFNTTIPPDLAPGEYLVTAKIDGQSTPPTYVLVTAAPPQPVITSIFSAANQLAGTAPASWILVNGTNLSNSTRTWTAVEANSPGGLPTTLDGVSVQVNNLPAFVQAVSPTQLVILTPSDPTTGPVNVQVQNNGAVSVPSSASMVPFAPALFTVDGKYLVTTLDANALDTRLDVYPATAAWPTQAWPIPPVAAQPGQTVSFYGTGFGPTDTPIVDGQLQTAAVNLTGPYSLLIGGEPAAVSFAGLAPGFAGVYQFTVVIPSDLPAGDQPVVITIGGSSTVVSASCCFVTLAVPLP